MISSIYLLVAFFLSFLAKRTHAAGETRIYIDQIPLYSELPSCAEDRLSAIVRAQFSGCGDDMQLTSFACFCIDSSSEFSSIISTAVAEQCSASQATTGSTGNSAQATSTGASAVAAGRAVMRRQAAPTTAATGAAADVTSAIEVWNSYCSKSTELGRFGQSTAGGTVTITQAPQTVTVAPASQNDGSKTPIAAIVVPVVVVPLAALAGLFMYLRHRRAVLVHKTNQGQPGVGPQEVDDSASRGELFSEGARGQEMQGSIQKHELDPAAYRAELDAGGMASENKEKSHVETQG